METLMSKTKSAKKIYMDLLKDWVQFQYPLVIEISENHKGDTDITHNIAYVWSEARPSN